MTGRSTRADLATASTLLERQWRTLRAWLGRVFADDPGHVVDAPSALPGYTVVELVAHVGRALNALAVAEPAAPAVTPLTLAEYFSAFHDRSEEVVQSTRELASEIAPAPLAAVDRMAAAAVARLAALGPHDRVVQTPRAPILLSDMALSRLIELVVHGDDLDRSVPRFGDHPVDPDALELTAQALLGIVVARGGWSLELRDPLLWVRLATGRLPRGPDRLGDALAPRFTSDSVPDLGRMLPLL
ncbi:maleylpyruvate isomerase N-terminal domain-containing protein [Pengzhenrongella sicca]|uniref:Maleylpyruvate isomerase N-terminal domain-containing protein n=1 Tax=Pengzhenrongella sicca TaxID=2819238 RepID=A0A8A4ZH04_9MICO|nr:maleylpyruvate isomerase N-terminal domain-containing protein [Pengzhenrongella sicca]QTE29777.1 maleylpyruvate isomerase N-terminal domain-containing protein [Pengzhenrongella sicca]